METAIVTYLTSKILELTGGGSGVFYSSDDIHQELFFGRDYLKGKERAVLLVSGAEETKPGQKNSLDYDVDEEVFKASRVVLTGWWEVAIRLYAGELSEAEVLARELRNRVAKNSQFQDEFGLWWQIRQRGMINYKRPSRMEPECRGIKLRFFGRIVESEADVPAMAEKLNFDKLTIQTSG